MLQGTLVHGSLERIYIRHSQFYGDIFTLFRCPIVTLKCGRVSLFACLRVTVFSRNALPLKKCPCFAGGHQIFKRTRGTFSCWIPIRHTSKSLYKEFACLLSHRSAHSEYPTPPVRAGSARIDLQVAQVCLRHRDL